MISSIPSLELRTSVLSLEKTLGKEFIKIAFPCKNGLDFVPIPEIMYCQSQGNLTKVFLTSGKHLNVSWMLGNLENKLPANWFIRVHHQYMVNMQHILRYEKGDGGVIYLDGNHRIPVSRERKKEFLGRVKEI